MMDGMNMNKTGAEVMNNGAGGGGMQPMMPNHQMMMHVTFFWGKTTEILFPGWPGYDNLGMYLLALVVVFALAFLVEWLSACKLVKENSNHVAAGMVQTLMYGIRAGLAYRVMLSVMSFNGGAFLVAVAGHALGFFFFASRAFNNNLPAHGKTSDLPPMSC